MNIYTPYTYLVHHIPTDTYYYGVRFAKNCNPNDLWVKYFTSSKTVRSLINQYGKDSFRCEVRKTFTDAKAALVWEHKVIRRMNAVKDPKWLNRNCGNLWCGRLAGFNHTEETKQRISKANKGNKLKLSDEQRQALSKRFKGKIGPRKGVTVDSETRELMRSKKVKPWIVISPEQIEFKIINLKHFCKETGLDAACMQKVAKGDRPHHKGYKCYRV